MDKTVKPRTYVMFRVAAFDGKAECYIHCYPQQKWRCRVDGKTANLEYKNISLSIPIADYEKYFMEVSEPYRP